MIHITERTSGSSVILTLNGRLKFESRKVFQQSLKEVQTKNPRHLVINLEKVTFIDSAGLGLLGLALEECKVNKRRCSLIRPAGPMNGLIEMAKFPELVPTFQSEQEALKASPPLAQVSSVN